MQVVYLEGDPRKVGEKGIETGKRRKPIQDALISGLLLWVAGCHWASGYRRLQGALSAPVYVAHASKFSHPKAKELGYSYTIPFCH